MADATPEVSTDFPQAPSGASSRHAAEALTSFVSEECLFESSAGPEVCATRNAAREAVRAGSASVWTVFTASSERGSSQ